MSKSSPPSAAPAGFLHELLDMKRAGEGGVEQIAREAARIDLDPQHYLKQTRTGQAKPLLITDYVSMTVQNAGEEMRFSWFRGATLKLAGTAKPKLSSVSPAMWISANARMMAVLVDRETWTSAASMTTWPTRRNWGSLRPATPGLLFFCTTKSTGVGRRRRTSAGMRTPTPINRPIEGVNETRPNTSKTTHRYRPTTGSWRQRKMSPE